MLQSKDGKEIVTEGEMFQRAMNHLGDEMIADSIKWFPPVDGLPNMHILVLGLVGESGEVADCFKKILRVGNPPTMAELAEIREELIDVFIYWTMLARMLGVNILSEYDTKRAFNEKRFGATSDDNAV